MLNHSTDKWVTILKVEFPTEQKLMEQWYQSPAYQANVDLREKARNILSEMVAFGGKQMDKKSYERDIWDRYLIHIEGAGFVNMDTANYNYDFDNRDNIATYYRSLIFLAGSPSTTWYYQFDVEDGVSYMRSEYATKTDLAITDSSGHISIMGVAETTNTDDTLRTAFFGTGWVPLSSVGENAQHSEMGDECMGGAIAGLNVNDILSPKLLNSVEICVQPSQISSVTIGDYLSVMVMSWIAPETQGMQVLTYVKYILTKAPDDYIRIYLRRTDKQLEIDGQLDGPATAVLENLLAHNYNFEITPYRKFFDKEKYNSSKHVGAYISSHLEHQFTMIQNPHGTLEYYFNSIMDSLGRGTYDADKNKKILSDSFKKFGIDIFKIKEFDDMFDFTIKIKRDFRYEKGAWHTHHNIISPSEIIPDYIRILLGGKIITNDMVKTIPHVGFQAYLLFPNTFPLPEKQWEELHEIHTRHSNGERFQQELTYKEYVELAKDSIDIMKKNLESDHRFGHPRRNPRNNNNNAAAGA